jgi:hypothetical protein
MAWLVWLWLWLWRGCCGVVVVVVVVALAVAVAVGVVVVVGVVVYVVEPRALAREDEPLLVRRDACFVKGLSLDVCRKKAWSKMATEYLFMYIYIYIYM